jgi:hypothetical protein
MKNLLRALFSLVFIISFNALAMDPPDISLSESDALIIDQESLTEYILKKHYGKISHAMMVNHSNPPTEIHQLFLYVLGLEFFISSSNKKDLWELIQCALGEDINNTSKYSLHNLKHIKQLYENLHNSDDSEVLRLLDELKSNAGNSRGNFYQLINHIFSAKMPDLDKKAREEYIKQKKKKKKKRYLSFLETKK